MTINRNWCWAQIGVNWFLTNHLRALLEMFSIFIGIYDNFWHCWISMVRWFTQTRQTKLSAFVVMLFQENYSSKSVTSDIEKNIIYVYLLLAIYTGWLIVVDFNCMLTLLTPSRMASVKTTLTTIVGKNGSHSNPSKFSNTSFLHGFDVRGNVASMQKKETYPTTVLVPKATLTFDAPATNAEKSRQRKHTVDPSAPDFLPLPSFEQCFPNSSKEYRCLLSFG